MNRNDILKAINYDGKYTKETKKKLRELLKKYHPDHYKKETDTFKIINEIKKELDNGKTISFKENIKDKKLKDDNYDIDEEILKLTIERNNLVLKKNKYQEKLSQLQDEYCIVYNNDVNYRNKAFDFS